MIDSHAHLAMFEEDALEGVLARAQEAGLEAIVNICTDPTELAHGIALAKKHPWIHNVGSTTPHDVDKEGESAFDAFATAARAGQLVAVGETGLDYFYDHSQPATQQAYLKRYLALAKECSLPVVIHCRDAFADFFSIIDAHYDGPGVLHCFTGTAEEAQGVIDRGWYLSLSGIVTFKKSAALREIAATLPLDRLLIETDAPFLAPQKWRGKQCEPAYVLETARCIAEARAMPLDALLSATAANTRLLFNI